MSVYVVNVNESTSAGQQANPVLQELSQQFNGDIFHRDGNHGAFMVHQSPDKTAEQHLDTIRRHFQASSDYQVEEMVGPNGHVVFNVNVPAKVDVSANKEGLHIKGLFL